MNISYEWLRAFMPLDLSPTALRDLITARVATVDELVPIRGDLAPIVVARVVTEAPHPDSDHLHVTKVDAGTGELLDVVCGAANVRAGKLYPFAATGTILPGGLRIEKRKIRGAVSNGMLCSAKELGLGDDHEGILELSVDVQPGTPLLAALPLGDTRFVVDVMPNRPDLLSHLGMAREIAAALGVACTLPSLDLPEVDVPEPLRSSRTGDAGGNSVVVEESGLVQRFMGVGIRGLTVKESPPWLAERLASVGVRSINNVVDASNYVLHELGQPTHAFDRSKLHGSALRVRLARNGESIRTLDGIDRKLDADMIVIADDRDPQAIAGIMGGAHSEVAPDTTDIFLEVANFEPRRIRQARRKLGLSTDASYRFERGVDIEIGPAALARAAALIIGVAGGHVDGLPVDIFSGQQPRPRLSLRIPRLAKLLGDPVSAEEASSLMRSIGFQTSTHGDGERLDVVPPTWRTDVTLEVDLVEEVARLRTYDSFSSDIRAFRPGNSPDAEQWLVGTRVRQTLVTAGLLEARPMPFVRGAAEGFVPVANPLSAQEAYLRREVLDTLARRAEYNLTQMQGNIRLFEIGSVFAPSEGMLPREELRAGALIMGYRRPPHFTEPKPPMFDQWDAKALGELVAKEAYPGGAVELRPASNEVLWTIVVDDEVRGVVRPVPMDAPVWAAPAYGVELSLGPVESAPVAAPGANAHHAGDHATSTQGSAPSLPRIAAPAVPSYRPLPTTPAAEFDLALVVGPSLRAADIESVIWKSAGELLERLELFDEYSGDKIGAGERSLAWRLTFRHADRTLREKEIEGRRNRILAALDQELHVRPRTA